MRFLKRGKTHELAGEGGSSQPENRRIPALLSLPESLWNSVSLVLNGSTSIVFHGNSYKMQGILEEIDLGARRGWAIFRDNVEAYFRSTLPEDLFYLKLDCRTHLFDHTPPKALTS